MAHPGVFAEHPGVERLVSRATGRVLDVASDGLVGEPGSFDTILSVRQLCSVADLDATLRCMLALLAPRGQLLAVEHVRATGMRGHLQDANAFGWRRIARGCRPNLDLIGAMRANGFAVTDCDRFMMKRTLAIVAPHVAVVAIPKVRNETTDEGESE